MTAGKSHEAPADQAAPPTTMNKPESVDKRTFAPEVELQCGSDQGCEPVTPAAEGTEVEDWLMDFDGNLFTPTLSHPVSSSSLFSGSTNDIMAHDLLFSLTCMNCTILTIFLSCCVQSWSSPVTQPHCCRMSTALCHLQGDPVTSSSRSCSACARGSCGSASCLRPLCSISGCWPFSSACGSSHLRGPSDLQPHWVPSFCRFILGQSSHHFRQGLEGHLVCSVSPYLRLWILRPRLRW